MIQKRLIEPSFKFTEREAVEFLKKRGYEVIPPKKILKNINSEKEKQLRVIQLFYDLLRSEIGDSGILFSFSNQKDDEKSLQRFLLKAERLAIPTKEALEYLEEAIKYLFNNIEELGITSIPKTLNFLLSSKFSWIFSKIKQTQHKKLKEFEYSEEAEKFKETLYDIEDDRLELLRKEKYKKYFKDIDNGKKES